MHNPCYDVTISVWNNFRSPELCEGLCRNDFSAIALRSEKKPVIKCPNKHSEISRILTRLFQRTQYAPLLEAAQNVFERFAAKNIPDSKVFWGWNGHNLQAFIAARQKGQRLICESGSTHPSWAGRVLRQVYKDLGWNSTSYQVISYREKQAIEECNIADIIMVGSKYAYNTYISEGINPSKLHINPYGVDLELWNRVQGHKRKIGPLVFIYTAAFIPRKGAHILLNAWDAAALKDAELWICGSIQTPIQKLGLPTGKSVRFLGFKMHSELAAIYDRASVYILPSFEEGLAKSGIEAMASGLPAIVTDETGLTDLMTSGNEGWIVQSGNIEQLAEVFRDISEKRDQLSARSIAARDSTKNSSKIKYGDRAAFFLKKFLTLSK